MFGLLCMLQHSTLYFLCDKQLMLVYNVAALSALANTNHNLNNLEKWQFAIHTDDRNKLNHLDN